uniref:Uncharacterized protein n=1 Tax=Rhizophagus irregularis (strain DAOM 181602 / DAOM 197198 / MUCL 43194) TaxID=747089 RepID=U9TU74_RHIID
MAIMSLIEIFRLLDIQPFTFSQIWSMLKMKNLLLMLSYLATGIALGDCRLFPDCRLGDHRLGFFFKYVT